MAGLEGTKTDRQALTGDISVKHGLDGESVTIVKITESTEDGGTNIVEFSDGSTLKIKNGSGGKIGIDGKSAYQYAQDGGYTGTEEEFALLMSQENLQTEKVDKISIEVSKLSEEIVDVNREVEKVSAIVYENEFDITNGNNLYKYGFDINGGMVATGDNNPIYFLSHKIKVIANKTYYIIKNNLNIGIDSVFLYTDNLPLESTSKGTKLDIIRLREIVKFTPTTNGYVVINAYLSNATSINDYQLFVGSMADGNYHVFGEIGLHNDAVKATLVNPAHIKDNYSLDDKGVLINGNNWYTSGYIRIKKGKMYGARKYNFNTVYTITYCLYDDNFNFVSTSSATGQFSFVAEIDGYIRLAVVGGGNLERCSFRCTSDMKQDGNTYYYGEEKIADSLLSFDAHYGFSNGVLTSFGDSLVGNNNWQSYVAKEFGMYHKNCGVGGSLVHGITENAMWQDSRINTIPTDTRLLIIHAGTNDDKDSTVIGELSEIGSTHDTNTFIGAYQTMLEKMYNRCPNARILILLPLYNSGENKLEEIREAIRNVACLYGYPYYESKKLMGFNKLNQSIYYVNGGVFVHTNELGGKRMADCIIGFVKNYQMTNELS